MDSPCWTRSAAPFVVMLSLHLLTKRIQQCASASEEKRRTLSVTSSFSVLQKQDKTSSAIQAHYLETLLCHQHCSMTTKRDIFCRGMLIHRMQTSKRVPRNNCKGNLISYSCPAQISGRTSTSVYLRKKKKRGKVIFDQHHCHAGVFVL